MLRQWIRLTLIALVCLASVGAAVLHATPAQADTGSNWTGAYYSNPSLLGSPTFTRIDPALVFNWGPYSPGPGIGSTYWSARWTAVQYLNAGTYRFTITSDDGVRMFIDGQNILDQWHDEAPTTYYVNVQVVAGNHAFQVDYYQATGDASLSVSWDSLNVQSTAWTAEYFPNSDLAGAALVRRYEDKIEHFWGTGSPDPSIPASNFSARYTATLPFSAATYRFTLAGDDGVRLFIDNASVIDQWHPETLTAYSIDVPLSAGLHTLRVEYFQAGGQAAVRFDYSVAIGPPPYPGTQSDTWYGEYFTNPNLQGSPAFIRYDGYSGINFNWTINPPVPGFQHDNYSVRWTRRIFFPGRPYMFYLTTDDGARLYIDTTLIVDAWYPQRATTYPKYVELTEGYHIVRLEYFQQQYDAIINLTWDPPNSQTPPQPPYGSQGNIPPSSGTLTGTVNTHALNVRSGPGINYDILTTIPRGEVFTVHGRNADSTWAQVTLANGFNGWLNTFYATFSGNINTAPVQVPPPPPQPQSIGVRGQLYSGLRVRSGPSTSFPQIGDLEWGTVVDIVGRSSSGTYYQIQDAGLTGWVYAPYITVIAGDISNVPVTG